MARWKARCQLPVSDNCKLQFSVALTAAALLSETCRNWRFQTGVGHFERKFQVDGDVARNPSMDR